ncbi:MAG: class II aldolase/adducin family protein [Deltaproteobacteria bacterium]|nr:class II aldolase/adducin family protein [Deltaproteobacteria bacterium]
MNHAHLRQQIVNVSLDLAPKGLSRGTSGNVSARVPEGYLITPSGVPYEALTPESIVSVGLDETPDEDTFPRPSSEWRFHRDIYRARPDAQAIVHAHPPFSTALACMNQGIPAFHYMVAAAGGNDLRCATYATFGTQELSDSILVALQDRKACLIGNHGIVAMGSNLAAALALTVTVEDLAEQYVRVLQMGKPVLLPDDEMARVLEKFKTYGKAKR